MQALDRAMQAPDFLCSRQKFRACIRRIKADTRLFNARTKNFVRALDEAMPA